MVPRFGAKHTVAANTLRKEKSGLLITGRTCLLSRGHKKLRENESLGKKKPRLTVLYRMLKLAFFKGDGDEKSIYDAR
jgi:hypothetical protein